MNSKIIVTSALAALIIPAMAFSQTARIERAEQRVVAIPYAQTAAVQQSELTGNFQYDLALAAKTDEQQADQTMLATGNKKNPIVGGLLSLAVPGAGQVYSGSYTRAAVYVAAEIAGIAWAILYNNKGDRRTEEFQAYADAHWSAVRYAQFLNNHAAQYRTNNDNANIPIDPNTSLPPWQRVDFNVINAYENGGWDRGFSHRLPAYGEQQYYELIGKYDQFKYGWDTYPHTGEIPADDLGDYASVPQQLKDYAATRGSANDFYASSRLAVSLVVINHVVSAVDGYLSARHYNAHLASGMSLEPAGGRMALTSRVTLSVGL